MEGPLNHVGYWVRNLEEALEPYRTLLGGRVECEIVSPYTGNRLGFVRVGGQMIELMEPVDKGILKGQKGPIHHHVAFEIKGIDDLVEALRDQGVICDPPEPEPCLIGGRTTLFVHPVLGGLIQVIER